MDIAIFDQAVRGYAHFQFAPNTIQGIPVLLGEHFHLILGLLAPLYWIWPDPIMLLVAQAAAMSIASVAIYLLARDAFGRWAGWAFQIGFLTFWGVVGGVIYDFHEVALAVPLEAWALWALWKRHNRLFWACIILSLFVKENMPLITIGVGAYAALALRRWRLGAAVIGVSLAYFGAVMTALSAGVFGSSYKFWLYSTLGPNATAAAAHVLRHPLQALWLAINQPIKVHTLLALGAPWLFLPVLSPIILPILPTVAERFLSDRSAYWEDHFHYTLTVAPLLAVAAIDALQRFFRWSNTTMSRRYQQVLVVMVVLLGIVLNVQWLRQFEGQIVRLHTADRLAVDQCLRLIPAQASVLASNGLTSHLTRRHKTTYVIRKPELRGDYLAVDLGTTYELSNTQINSLLQSADDAGYQPVCSAGPTVVMARHSKIEPAVLSPDVENFRAAFRPTPTLSPEPSPEPTPRPDVTEEPADGNL